MAERLSAPGPMIIWARSSTGSVEIVRENGMVALSWGAAFAVVREGVKPYSNLALEANRGKSGPVLEYSVADISRALSS